MSREARRARQKEFVKGFNRLVGAYAPWQIWCDMVQMYACAIANSIPFSPHREKREKLYMDIIGKYSRDEMDIFANMVGLLVDTMEASVTVDGDYGDFLGELFMELNLGNNLGGQFFTPYGVCLMMANCAWNDSIPREIERRGYIAANDCACGAGATLIAFAQVCREKGVNYQRDVLFVGQDIDSTTAMMCYIQLSLLGCAGYVHIGNTLTEPMTGHTLFGDNAETTWYTPMYYTDCWELRRIRARDRRIRQTETAAPPEPEARAEAGGQKLVVSDRKKNKGQIMMDLG